VLAPVFTDEEQALLDGLLAIVADPTVPDEEVGGLLRGEKVGCARRSRPRCRRCRAITGTWPRLTAHTGICGDGQVLELSTFPGVENVALAGVKVSARNVLVVFVLYDRRIFSRSSGCADRWDFT
jgi:hypothetical protein